MKRYTADQLEHDPHFSPVNRLHYDNTLEFVWQNIRYKNLASGFYFFVNIFSLLFLLMISIHGFIILDFLPGRFLPCLLWGIVAGSFIVIPVHEGLHGLAYMLTGAPAVHFGADLKQMLFYVAANRHVLGRKGFYFIALTPFSVINILSILAASLLSPYWHIFFVCFLLFHNIMCIGDFAMISYFVRHPQKELYTFDDHQSRISYIYERIQDDDRHVEDDGKDG